MDNKIYNELLKKNDLPRGGVVDEGGTAHHKKTGDWSTVKPVKNDKCINCLTCWAYCPDTAVLVKDGKIAGFDYEHCKGCGICANICPDKIKAISMVEM